MKRCAVLLGLGLFLASTSHATVVTDPDDPRTWQGASVETFRQLLGFDTRLELVNAEILDDGIFETCINLATFPTPGASVPPCNESVTCLKTGTYIGAVQGAQGHNFDPATYNYAVGSAEYALSGSCLDMYWLQDLGDGDVATGNIWDLRGPSNQAAVFPVVDHGPLPEEAIEYSVYLSNNPEATQAGTDGETEWVLASLDRVYLEGWHDGWVADGFTTVWRLPGGQTFRYVNVVAGGPGALLRDGDDEIDTVLGLTFRGEPVCPGETDADGDGVCDNRDNCPDIHNPLQEDLDENGFGDVCEPPTTTTSTLVQFTTTTIFEGSSTTVSSTTSSSTSTSSSTTTFTTSTTLLPLCPDACGDPAGRRGIITAVDAAAILRAAVGLRACELCVCDVDDSGEITASDALLDLQFAVGLPVFLSCPPLRAPVE